jgi:hypothetical protein
MSQLLAGRVDPLINGDLKSLALHAPFGDQTVLDAFVDDGPGVAARSEDRGHLAFRGRKREPAISRCRGGIGFLDDVVAEYRECGPSLADIGERRDRAQLIGALTDVHVHSRHCAAARLDHRERLACVDRGQLLPIADENELVHAERLGDAVELQHVAARDHRSLIDNKHAASERRARRLVSIRPLLRDKPLVGQHERGDRLRLDPRPLGKVGNHLVLKGKPHDHTPFSLRDTRDRLEHGRLSGARDALHNDRTIGGRKNHRRGRELARIEGPLGRVLEAARRGFRRDDRARRPPPFIDGREDRLLGLERLARRHHAPGPVGSRRDARNELSPVDERHDPALDTIDRDALQTEIERGLGERIDRPGCFPLAKDANRRCNGKLGPRRGGRGYRTGEAGVDEGIVGAEQPAEPLARRVDRVRYRAITLVENAVRGNEDGPRFGCRGERLAVETECGRPAGPIPVSAPHDPRRRAWDRATVS